MPKKEEEKMAETAKKVKEICPRCDFEEVEEIEPNGRGKDRKCGRCGVIWDHNDPENTWSMICL